MRRPLEEVAFLERVYREALRHSRGPPPIEARLDELRASNLQVAQILDLVEHAHVLVHGSRSAIAPTIYDSQPVQRLLDAPRRRLFNYPLLLRELERAMPPSHPARANVRELAAKVERVAARVDDPLDAFLGERRGEFLFQDEVRALRSSLDVGTTAPTAPTRRRRRRSGGGLHGLDEFQAEYEVAARARDRRASVRLGRVMRRPWRAGLRVSAVRTTSRRRRRWRRVARRRAAARHANV